MDDNLSQSEKREAINWFKYTLEDLSMNRQISTEDIQAILIETILDYLQQKYDLPMLLEMTAIIVEYHKSKLTPDMFRTIQKINWLKRDSQSTEVEKLNFLSKILEDVIKA